MNLNKWLLGLCVPLATLYAQDDLFNEADLFNDTAMVIDSQVVTKTVSSVLLDSTKVVFSGDIQSVAQLSANRNWFKDLKKKDTQPGASIVGNGLLDIRLPLGVKAFANLEAQYSSSNNSTAFSIQELFIDANIKQKVYIRSGKQVLQWGRCYFWNPTDLVNIEKKKFVQDVGYLEGTYGIKAHVPFGTRWNMYGFIDMNNLKSVDSLSATAKVEVLLGGTEMATAIWGKRSKDPVFGFDFSTSLLDVNISGELNLTSGKNYSIPDINKLYTVFSIDQTGNPQMTGLLPMTTIDKKVLARACLGLSKSFDLLDITDRVMAVAEFYFNGAGYDENIIKEYHIGDMVQTMKSGSLNSQSAAYFQGSMSSLINPNNHSMWYGAFFVNISKFLISELTLSVNGIANFNHKCAMISTGLQYVNMHRFSMGFIVNSIIGPENTEYTLSGDAATLRLTAGVSF